MQCQHCGKSDWVTIGNQKYCASCGEPNNASAVAAPTIAQPSLTQPASPNAQIQTATAPAIAAPAPIPTNSTTPPSTDLATPKPSPAPVLKDLSSPPAPSLSPTPLPATSSNPVKPANSFHNPPTPAAAGVLDLRQMAVIQPPAHQDEPAKTPIPVAQPGQIQPPQPTISAPPPPPASTNPISSPTVTPAPLAAVASPIAIAAAPTTPPQQPTVSPPTTPQVIKPNMDAVTPSITNPASAIQKFVRPDTIAPAHLPAPPQPVQELPNSTVTQVESLQRLIPPNTIPSTNPQLANLSNPSQDSRPKVQNVMAATLAIMVMGGYIWLNNFNNLTVKSAAKKAGIQASLPGYMPNSYNLAGPVDYGQGFVTLNFKSPNSSAPLTITQRRTNWDSSALLQLFVHPNSNSYVSVANQGLTIYLYDNNQATWVNKGLQYVITGNTRLSKDQILKIASSL